MKHKLKIGASKNSLKSSVVTYKKVSPDVKAKELISESNKVTIIVPGDLVKTITIEGTKEEPSLAKTIPKLIEAVLIMRDSLLSQSSRQD